jgi:hypothetical protein
LAEAKSITEEYVKERTTELEDLVHYADFVEKLGPLADDDPATGVASYEEIWEDLTPFKARGLLKLLKGTHEVHRLAREPMKPADPMTTVKQRVIGLGLTDGESHRPILL